MARENLLQFSQQLDEFFFEHVKFNVQRLTFRQDDYFSREIEFAEMKAPQFTGPTFEPVPHWLWFDVFLDRKSHSDVFVRQVECGKIGPVN